jgi:hypothetical protein
MTSTARQLRQLLTIEAIDRGQYFADVAPSLYRISRINSTISLGLRLSSLLHSTLRLIAKSRL